MDVYITKLRKHLKPDDQIEIINIHGKGYKLIVPDDEETVPAIIRPCCMEDAHTATPSFPP